MPLAPSGLKTELQALSTTPGPTIAACAATWATAMKNYAAGIVPPSATVNAAASTLRTALAVAFALPAAAPSMESAFAAFATTVGGGMAAFVPTPPPTPVGFATQFLAFPATSAAAATALSGLIDTWMKKGSATPAAGGAPVPWS